MPAPVLLQWRRTKGVLMSSSESLPGGFWVWSKTWSERVGSLKALGMAAVAAFGLLAMAYNHFARRTELEGLRQQQALQIAAIQKEHDSRIQALVCDLKLESQVSANVVNATRRIREALKSVANEQNPARLLDELRESLKGVDSALDEIGQAHSRRAQQMIGGEKPSCKT